MEDFFDAVLFLNEEESFAVRQASYEDRDGMNWGNSFFAEGLQNENVFKSEEITENIENNFEERIFASETDFSKAAFPSENHTDIQEFSVRNTYGDMKEEKSVFNSLEEVSNIENTDNSNKNTMISIDARSYNTVSSGFDLEAVSDYIADRLSEALSAFSEGVHYV